MLESQIDAWRSIRCQSVIIRQARVADLNLLERYVKPAIGRTFKLELDEQARDEHSFLSRWLRRRSLVGVSFDGLGQGIQRPSDCSRAHLRSIVLKLESPIDRSE